MLARALAVQEAQLRCEVYAASMRIFSAMAAADPGPLKVSKRDTQATCEVFERHHYFEDLAQVLAEIYDDNTLREILALSGTPIEQLMHRFNALAVASIIETATGLAVSLPHAQGPRPTEDAASAAEVSDLLVACDFPVTTVGTPGTIGAVVAASLTASEVRDIRSFIESPLGRTILAAQQHPAMLRFVAKTKSDAPMRMAVVKAIHEGG